MEQAIRRAYLEMHLAVLLFGFTAILGDLIQLSAWMLVWWRVLFTCLSLAPLAKPLHLWRSMSRGVLLRFVGIGVLVGLHWLTFYHAIKVSNPSICLVCFASTAFFTSMMEPAFTKGRFNWREMFLGALMIPGMVMVVSNIEESSLPGIFYGGLSALLAATFSVLNKKYIGQHSAIGITFLELGSAWLFISLAFPFLVLSDVDFGTWLPPRWQDWVYLLLLSLLCTSLAYTLNLRAIRYISAFAANLTINLEPVYGIALAYWLLDDGQELTPGFYWGALIILSAVFLYPVMKKRWK